MVHYASKLAMWGAKELVSWLCSHTIVTIPHGHTNHHTGTDLLGRKQTL